MTEKLRTRVWRRARGRCEYCRTPFHYDQVPAEVDHIIAQQHRGATVISNLAAACAHCNSHKGTNIASIDPTTRKMVPLFHPRKDRWERHFRWAGAQLVGQTPQGRATVFLLAINDPAKVAARAALMDEGVF
jgi:5-methylcytosine-specific restriction endonuclease McrA